MLIPCSAGWAHGEDKLDVSGLASVNCAGSDPIGDGSFATAIDGVTPPSLTASDFVFAT